MGLIDNENMNNYINEVCGNIGFLGVHKDIKKELQCHIVETFYQLRRFPTYHQCGCGWVYIQHPQAQGPI